MEWVTDLLQAKGMSRKVVLLSPCNLTNTNSSNDQDHSHREAQIHPRVIPPDEHLMSFRLSGILSTQSQRGHQNNTLHAFMAILCGPCWQHKRFSLLLSKSIHSSFDVNV